MGCSELTVRIKIPNGAERIIMKKLLGILLLTGATFLTGCGSSNDGINEISGQQGNPFFTAAPVCADDAYATNANQTLTVNAANGVLANDTPNGATLTFDAASTQNGTVTMNQDGSFTYAPPSSTFNGQDTFTYTLTNTLGTTTCTVTITVTAVNGFFVDATNGSDTTGSFNGGNPFATIQAAAAAAPAGSDIVVRPGNYTGAVNLENGDRLLGEGSVLAQGTPVRPTLTGPVVLGDGCTVDFVRIDGTAGDAIDGDGQNGGTVTNCEIANTTNGGEGVNLQDSSGTWNVSSNTISNIAEIGIEVRLNGSQALTIQANDNVITNCGLDAIGFETNNSSQLTAQIHRNNMTGNVAGATFEGITGNTSVMCLDIEDNDNDDVYRFSELDTSDLRVEQFGELETINNSGTVSVSGASNPISTTILDGA